MGGVGSWDNCPSPTGTPLGAISREGDVERLKVPVFGGGDEGAGSTGTDVGTLTLGGGAKEASAMSDPPFIRACPQSHPS